MKILDETMYILETIEYDKTDSDKYQLMTGKEVLEFIKERAVDILEDYERVGYDDLVWIGIIEFLKNTIDGDEKSIDEFLDIYSYNVGAYHGYLYNPKMREMKKEIEELGACEKCKRPYIVPVTNDAHCPRCRLSSTASAIERYSQEELD